GFQAHRSYTGDHGLAHLPIRADEAQGHAALDQPRRPDALRCRARDRFLQLPGHADTYSQGCGGRSGRGGAANEAHWQESGGRGELRRLPHRRERGGRVRRHGSRSRRTLLHGRLSLHDQRVHETEARRRALPAGTLGAYLRDAARSARLDASVASRDGGCSGSSFFCRTAMTGTHPWLASLHSAASGKVVSAVDAARLIRDGDTVATGGFVGIGFAEEIAIALEELYL